jgi:dinuclear metal center YbgI/SA1388 family protein
MISRNNLVNFLDTLVPALPGVDDASNNGLQVEGVEKVERVAFGVDACESLFTASADKDIDFIIVHHGLSWGDNLKFLQDITATRLRVLFGNGMSLYASHLPLDANCDVGHNAEIARRLGLEQVQPAFEYHGAFIGQMGEFAEMMSMDGLVAKIDKEFGGKCQAWRFGRDEVRKIGIVSGGGADAIPEAAKRGMDCLVTGEVTHQHYHLMKEYGLNVLAAGHYVTEKPGLEAVMARVSQEFSVKCEFIELPTEL